MKRITTKSAPNPPRRLGQCLLGLLVTLCASMSFGELEPEPDRQRGWRMLSERAAFCPAAELETCLEENGGPLVSLVEFYEQAPERFWVGWKDSCVRPPTSYFEHYTPIALGAEANEAISSSRSIIHGRVHEVAVGFFTPDLAGSRPALVMVATMILLEEMDVLKHTRLVLGPAIPTPNPLQPGTFALLAPVGSARLGELELCARDATNTPPLDVLVPGDHIILFSRAGLAPAALNPGGIFDAEWVAGELTVFDSAGGKKFNPPALAEDEKAAGTTDLESLLELIAERGEDR